MVAPDLDAKVREHALLVNREMERYLPREKGKFASSMREYLERGNRRVRPSLAVYEPIRHVVAAGGKRIRPTLCLLACEAAAGKIEQALPTAVGIEFLHTFTLVHDDIMDRALTRRGKPTVGALWGDDVAITVGDGLFALAFKAFAANAEVPGVTPERVNRVVAAASETSLLLAQGQTLDLLFARRDDVAPDEYLEMVRLKTGVLLEFAVAAGATLGGADETRVAAMARFASPLGVAFQLRDDLLDLTGDATVTGKPMGGDIRTGKRTLVVAHAFAHSPKAKRLAEILDAPVEETSDADVAEAIAILRDAGSIDYARRAAERYLGEAKKALAELPATSGSRTLESLGAIADYILHREK